MSCRAAPDRPYNDVQEALEALLELYELIPDVDPGKAIPWSTLERELRAALTPREPDLNKRIASMQNLIKQRFGDKAAFDVERFRREGPLFRLWIDRFRIQVDQREAAPPTNKVAPLR